MESRHFESVKTKLEGRKFFNRTQRGKCLRKSQPIIWCVLRNTNDVRKASILEFARASVARCATIAP